MRSLGWHFTLAFVHGLSHLVQYAQTLLAAFLVRARGVDPDFTHNYIAIGHFGGLYSTPF
jgi:hypothetical protein